MSGLRFGLWWLVACGGGEPADGPTDGTSSPPTETGAPTVTDTPTAPPDPTGTTGHTGATTAPLVPPPFDADFLWATLTFDDAVDLGHAPAEVPAASRVEPGPVTLAEVAMSVGLEAGVAGGNSHGVGVGFFDADGDGWDDLLVASGFDNTRWHPSSLWRNRGDGTFEDVTGPSGLGAILAQRDLYSVAAADYDADGDLDLYLGAHPTDLLLQNQGGGVFVDVTAAAGAGGPPSTAATNGSSKIGAWGDYDGDGWVDVAVASSTFDDHPPHGYLLRNRGDGTFEDATATSGLMIPMTGNPCAVLWSDHDNDGDQDLIVYNDRGHRSLNRALLDNLGDGTFVDWTDEALLRNPMGNPMGIDGADVDRNGLLDYYVGNIGGNALLMGQPGGTYIDFALAAGVLGEYGWGLGFEDLDADGWWDLFLAQEDTRPFATFTHDRVVPPTFTRQNWDHPGVNTGHNRPAAFADYDRDGDVDVVVGNTAGQRLLLYRNDTDRGTNRFLEVEVAASPGVGERGGIGGRVVVKVGDTVLWRDLTGGSSRASQNALSARFGLGHWDGAEWVAVLWPDGRQLAAIHVPGDTRLTLTAP